MKKKTLILLAALAMSHMQVEAQQSADAKKKSEQEAKDYETNPEVVSKMLAAGKPSGNAKEGLMFQGLSPQPWLKDIANWFPGKEEVQPNEMRVTFMGTSPLQRPAQFGTSIFVELGNGDSFIFDFGPVAIANYMAAGVPINRINNIFITHLHWDHFSSVPVAYMYGPRLGRWEEPLKITGPSGRTPQHGLKTMVGHMQKMMNWGVQANNVFPAGKGFEIEVNEFDFKDDGGVVYEKNGAKIIHWRQSHAGGDGASAYRLDWNGLSMSFTGDGRPNSLTSKYAKGVDLLITEIQAELLATTSAVMGTMPILGRLTVDTSHDPAYAAGYLYNQVQPRLAIGTHVNFDSYSNEEILAEVRTHWNGPFHLGAPDMVVVNITKDHLWVRDGIIAKFPNLTPAQHPVKNGGIEIPAPKYSRAEIQDQSIRDQEIDPTLYYPAGYKPELLQAWPTKKTLLMPTSVNNDKTKK